MCVDVRCGAAEIPAHRCPKPRYVARPSSRAYHRRPALISGIQAAVWAGARRRVWVWILQSRQGTVRVHDELRALIDEIIMIPGGPFTALTGKIMQE